MNDDEKDNILEDVYYEQGYQFGIKKIYELLKQTYPIAKISFRYVKGWLEKQPSYQINQLQRQTKHIKPIISKRKLNLIQMDLIDYSQNTAPNGYKYIMNIIDVYSRYSWLIILKNKQADTITRKFKEWYESVIIEAIDNLHPIKILQTDDGGEFKGLSEFLKSKSIKHIISTSPQSQSIVERCNQTVRRLLGKLISIKTGSVKWSLIPIVNKNYNSSYHSTIYMTPLEKYTLSNEELKDDLHQEQLIDSEKKLLKRNEPILNSNIDLEPDDWVRIKRLKKNPLDKTKGYNNFSEEIYFVVRKIKSRKIGINDRYKLKNKQGNIFKKTYYRDDLLKISKDTDTNNNRINSVNEPILIEHNNTKHQVNTLVSSSPPRRSKRTSKPIRYI